MYPPERPLSSSTPALRNLATAVFLIAGLTGPPAASARQTQRVLARDPIDGGPSGVRVDELTPAFSDEEVRSALVALDEGDASLAAGLLPDWIDAHPDSPQRPLASFALGYAMYRLQRWDEAAAVLVACGAEGGLLADYCLYWAADVAMETGDSSGADALAALVPDDSVFAPRALFLRGRAQAEVGDWAGAVATLEDFLSRWPNASYRDDVEMALGQALTGNGQIDDAARLYHRLVVMHPGDSIEGRAQTALDGIASAVSEPVRVEVTRRSHEETIARARVLFDRQRSEQVVDLLVPILEELPAGDLLACEASWLVGKSLSKLRRHRDSIPYYETIAANCPQDEDLRVRALYNLGRGLWNADRDEDAVTRFRQLWEEHPSSSYADDALLLAARVLRGNGDSDGSSSLLAQQISSYPDGDMLKDAVWLQMADLYGAGQLREAIAFAEAVGSATGERDLYSRGRIAYFRGRALEQLSMRDEAVGAYSQVMRDHPMGWYALLSLNRLLVLDGAHARALVGELRQPATATEGFISVDPPEIAEDSAFRRGVALLSLGLHGLARGEFSLLEARFPNQPQIEWLVALLFHRAGAYEISHHVPGDREGLNLAYPAGSNLERWQVAYPLAWFEQVEPMAQTRELDPYLVMAIMREESGFRADIESWANARGLLQLMHGTANDMAELTGRGTVTERQLFDPEINIELGTMFMRRLSDRFDAHPALVIGGYNGGAGNINNWLTARGSMPLDLWVEEIPYEQTRDYVKRVTMTYFVYRWLYSDGDPWVVLPSSLPAAN